MGEDGHYVSVRERNHEPTADCAPDPKEVRWFESDHRLQRCIGEAIDISASRDRDKGLESHLIDYQLGREHRAYREKQQRSR